MQKTPFQPGDWVIYRKTKFSTHPGPRAENISAAENGDLYVYTVDKFWIVEAVENGVLTLRTRRGKRHSVKLPAPNLHKANLLERWWFRSRFETVASGATANIDSPAEGVAPLKSRAV